MSVSNLTKWQRKRIESRLLIVDEILSNLRNAGVEFKCVTYLARYLAGEIAERERTYTHQRLDQESDMAISKRRVCVPATLLKSNIYRLRLDAWMLELHPVDRSRHRYELELEYKLNRLTNKYQILEDEYLRLQELVIQSNSEAEPKASIDAEAGFMMTDKLIRAFSEFCLVEAGALKENLVTKPTILSPELYALYLEWKGREL